MGSKSSVLQLTGMFDTHPLMCAQMFVPTYAEAEDLVQFHDSDYIAFLRTVTPDNQVQPVTHFCIQRVHHSLT